MSETTGHSSLDFIMSPDSLRSFMLGSSTYNVTWLNNENSITTTYDFTLNIDYVLTLNTSYYNIFFSLFDLNLHIIDSSQYVFRLNSSIYDFGMITDLQSDDYNITVDDRFGNSVAISGDYIVVGAKDEETGGIRAGSAYLFKKQADGGLG